jgi:hypothetical protein
MTVYDYMMRNGRSFFASRGFENEERDLSQRTKPTRGKCQKRRLTLVADLNGRHVATTQYGKEGD